MSEPLSVDGVQEETVRRIHDAHIRGDADALANIGLDLGRRIVALVAEITRWRLRAAEAEAQRDRSLREHVKTCAIARNPAVFYIAGPSPRDVDLVAQCTGIDRDVVDKAADIDKDAWREAEVKP